MISHALFNCVEFAGFYDMSLTEMNALLDRYNLEGVSAHISADSISSCLEYIDVIGIKSVYIPFVSYAKFKDSLQTVVKQ